MDEWYELFMKGPDEKVLPGKPQVKEFICVPENIIIPEKEEEPAFCVAYGISTEKRFNPCVIKEIRQDSFTIREMTIGELERLQEHIKEETGKEARIKMEILKVFVKERPGKCIDCDLLALRTYEDECPQCCALTGINIEDAEGELPESCPLEEQKI